MMLTLDNLAHRYNLLPSEAICRANTFDLFVLDVSARWSNRREQIANGSEPATAKPQLSQEQMQAMIDRVRNKK